MPYNSIDDFVSDMFSEILQEKQLPFPNDIVPAWDNQCADRILSAFPLPAPPAQDGSNGIYDKNVKPKDNNEPTEEEGMILGWYKQMHSPGKIVFHKENIKKFACMQMGWLIRNCYPETPGYDMLLLSLAFTTEDVKIHESFHYYCDAKRYLTGSLFDSDKEEALAVAHSHMTIKKDFNWGVTKKRFGLLSSMNKSRFNIVKDALLNNYYRYFTLPGYRDWTKYNGEIHYEREYYDYLTDAFGKLDYLRGNGIPAGDVKQECKLLGDTGAEKFVYTYGVFTQITMPTIGQYAKSVFSRLLTTGKLNPFLISNLMNKTYCRTSFGVSFPILVDTSAVYDNSRYYHDVFCGHYKICSQWYERNRARLFLWLRLNRL